MSKAETADATAVLETVFHNDDINRDLTVREYLRELLLTLWREADGFSGKRPFGNSGWQTDVESGLVGAGVIDGEIDEDGYLESGDDWFDDLIIRCIKAL